MNNQQTSRRHKVIYLIMALTIVFSTIGYSGIMALKEAFSEPEGPAYLELPTRAAANATIEAGINYRKVTSRSEIPDDIWDAINELELDRGSAGFTRMEYSSDNLWVLLCGGESYAQGYDAEIDYIRYGIIGWLSEAGENNSTPIQDSDRVYSGVYIPVIREIATDQVMDYATEAKYPFVLFEITTPVLEYDYLNGQVLVGSDEQDALLSLQHTE